jgi:hypothetical protein
LVGTVSYLYIRELRSSQLDSRSSIGMYWGALASTPQARLLHYL